MKIVRLCSLAVLAWWLGGGPAPAWGAGSDVLKLVAQARYLPGVSVLVRLELLDATGRRDWNSWDALATLSADQPGVLLSTNRLLLRNGLGSALVTFSGGGDFNLTATLGGLQTSHPLQSATNVPVTAFGGTLPGSSTTWSGVILITNDLTVSPGHTLIVLSNTLVLVKGLASGTMATTWLVNGTIQCLGTEEFPIAITCADPGLRWGQIRHNSASLATAPLSVYRYTSITRAGRAPGEGHTGQAPVIRPNNSKLLFEHCNITDHAEIVRGQPGFGTPGKIMFAAGSELTFNDCLLSRARMGPEIQGTALLFTNSYILDMGGPDDSDGIYLHDQAAGQEVKLSGCVLAQGDDDGIDTLGSIITVENCLIRNWDNLFEDAKGISVFNGATHVRRSLIVDCTVGIAAKWSDGAAALVTINNSTLSGNGTNVLAQRKSNAPGPFVDYRITNSVLWSGEAVQSDFGPTNFTIVYSDLSEPWPGVGNAMADPLFVNAAAHDFHLQPYSQCIDAGNPTSPLDPDGSRADLGCFTFVPPPPLLETPQIAPGGTFQFVFSGYSNRQYVIESSSNALTWATFRTITQWTAHTLVSDPAGANDGMHFYKARVAP